MSMPNSRKSSADRVACGIREMERERRFLIRRRSWREMTLLRLPLRSSLCKEYWKPLSTSSESTRRARGARWEQGFARAGRSRVKSRSLTRRERVDGILAEDEHTQKVELLEQPMGKHGYVVARDVQRLERRFQASQVGRVDLQQIAVIQVEFANRRISERALLWSITNGRTVINRSHSIY